MERSGRDRGGGQEVRREKEEREGGVGRLLVRPVTRHMTLVKMPKIATIMRYRHALMARVRDRNIGPT